MHRITALTFSGALGFALVALGCDKPREVQGEGGANESTENTASNAASAEVEAQGSEAPAEAAPPTSLDACALLPAEEVAEALGVSSDDLVSGKDQLRVMGDFVGWCGYKVGNMVRVSFTVALDEGREDFEGLKRSAAPEGIIRPATDVGGLPAVHRSTDGTLMWSSTDQLLFAVSVKDEKGMPRADLSVARTLAESIVARL